MRSFEGPSRITSIRFKVFTNTFDPPIMNLEVEALGIPFIITNLLVLMSNLI